MWLAQDTQQANLQTVMQAYIEGPYGAPMIDVLGSRYKCFLIVSSGLGWTFLRSWKRQLLQDAVRGRELKAIRSVAIMKHKYRHCLHECMGAASATSRCIALALDAADCPGLVDLVLALRTMCACDSHGYAVQVGKAVLKGSSSTAPRLCWCAS
jgi:hypothetical protein